MVKVSLESAIEAASERREFLPLEEIEAQLPELWREARVLARSTLTAAQGVRGLPLDKNAIPSEQIELIARGTLLGLVSPGEQHALAALLAKR